MDTSTTVCSASYTASRTDGTLSISSRLDYITYMYRVGRRHYYERGAIRDGA